MLQPSGVSDAPRWCSCGLRTADAAISGEPIDDAPTWQCLQNSECQGAANNSTVSKSFQHKSKHEFLHHVKLILGCIHHHHGVVAVLLLLPAAGLGATLVSSRMLTRTVSSAPDALWHDWTDPMLQLIHVGQHFAICLRMAAALVAFAKPTKTEQWGCYCRSLLA